MRFDFGRHCWPTNSLLKTDLPTANWFFSTRRKMICNTRACWSKWPAAKNHWVRLESKTDSTDSRDRPRPRRKDNKWQQGKLLKHCGQWLWPFLLASTCSDVDIGHRVHVDQRASWTGADVATRFAVLNRPGQRSSGGISFVPVPACLVQLHYKWIKLI